MSAQTTRQTLAALSSEINLDPAKGRREESCFLKFLVLYLCPPVSSSTTPTTSPSLVSSRNPSSARNQVEQLLVDLAPKCSFSIASLVSSTVNDSPLYRPILVTSSFFPADVLDHAAPPSLPQIATLLPSWPPHRARRSPSWATIL